MKLLTVILAVGMTAVLSCVKADDDKFSAAGSSLTGIYVSDCIYENNVSEKIQWEFADQKFKFTNFTGVDPDCTRNQIVMELHGSYTLGSRVTMPDGAQEIDLLKFTHAVVTIKEQDILDYWNGTSPGSQDPAKCGGGFILNQPRELNSTNCANDAQYGHFFPGRTEYSVFKIEDSKLFMGRCDQPNTCVTANNRPRSLETKSFTKK